VTRPAGEAPPTRQASETTTTATTGTSSLGRAGSRSSAVEPSPLFTILEWNSFCHSCVYLSLLICAFALHEPQPETFVLGLTHGILWIAMSLACITAARMRIVSLRLAVAVAVLGGIGPFFGSWEFVRAQRRYPKGTRQASTRRPHC
jgi:hypothetical protein